MNIRKENYALIIALLGVMAILVIPACSDIDGSVAAARKGSDAMQAGQAETTGNTDETNGSSVFGNTQVSGVATLEFAIGNGEVECVVGDVKPGEVSLSWEIIGKKGLFKKVGDPNDMEIEVTQDGDRLIVKSHWQGNKMASKPPVELVISAHPDIVIEGALGNGVVKIEDHHIADLAIGNGEVRISGQLAGDADISLGNGEIKGNLQISQGKHDISVGNGSVDIEISEGSSFRLDSTVGIGSISVKGTESKKDKSFLGGSVSAEIGDGAGMLDVSVGNGQIEVLVAANS